MQRTMGFQRVGACVILYHTPKSPADREWSAYIDFLAQHTGPRTRILVVTYGGAPSPAQRKALTTMCKEKYGGNIPTAVMSDDQLVRGVVTAINWLLPSQLRAFPMLKLEEALLYLELPLGLVGDIRQVIANLQMETTAPVPA